MDSDDDLPPMLRSIRKKIIKENAIDHQIVKKKNIQKAKENKKIIIGPIIKTVFGQNSKISTNVFKTNFIL
jgi:hypothetical protein